MPQAVRIVGARGLLSLFDGRCLAIRLAFGSAKCRASCFVPRAASFLLGGRLIETVFFRKQPCMHPRALGRPQASNGPVMGHRGTGVAILSGGRRVASALWHGACPFSFWQDSALPWNRTAVYRRSCRAVVRACCLRQGVVAGSDKDRFQRRLDLCGQRLGRSAPSRRSTCGDRRSARGVRVVRIHSLCPFRAVWGVFRYPHFMRQARHGPVICLSVLSGSVRTWVGRYAIWRCDVFVVIVLRAY